MTGPFQAAIIMLGLFTFSRAAQIAGVYTASPRAIVVVVQMSTSEATVTPPTSGWTVDGAAPVQVGRYSCPWDELAKSGSQYPIIMRHHIYLVLSQNLVSGASYAIVTPYGDTSLAFSDHATICESIKINQVGYDGDATVRYANFAIFLGDLGAQRLSSLPQYQVMRESDLTVVASGTLTYWGADTGSGVDKSGDFVYRIDLRLVPEGGPYFIAIDGIGRSYSFGVGRAYVREIAKTYAQGMFHQRCGIALSRPYTEYIRGACHLNVAFTKQGPDPESGREGEGWINVPAGAAMHEIHGGYHDAGDFDRRIYHTIIPVLMLGYFEAFPGHFIDGQYNIPDRFDAHYNILGQGNGIPDFLDEAMWGVLFWEYMQLDSTNSTNTDEYGGVMAGTECNAHPVYGAERADTDTRKYGTYAVSNLATAFGAGMFGHASRLIRPYDAQKADQLLTRARLSWNYLIRKNVKSPSAAIMYAALQLYLATATGNATIDRQNTFHVRFRGLADTLVARGGSWPDQYLPGNGSSTVQTVHFVSYLLTSFDTEPTLATALRNAIKSAADRGGYMEWTPQSCPYAQGVTRFMGWGASTAQGRYADPCCFMYRLSTSQQEKQKYYDIISQYANYALGLNPLGRSYVTGLGHVQPQSPCHLDSWYTKYGQGPFHSGNPIGNVPGILVYGPCEGHYNNEWENAVADKIYPSWDNLPCQRRYGDGWSLIATSEFTTWETNVWNTCMYGALYDASSDVTGNSGGFPHQYGKNRLVPDLDILVQGRSIICRIAANKCGHASLTLYDIQGRTCGSTHAFAGAAGRLTLRLNATGIGNGTHVARVQSGGRTALKGVVWIGR